MRPSPQAMAGPDESLVLGQRRHTPVARNQAMTSNPGNRWGRFYATLGRE